MRSSFTFLLFFLVPALFNEILRLFPDMSISFPYLSKSDKFLRSKLRDGSNDALRTMNFREVNCVFRRDFDEVYVGLCVLLSSYPTTDRISQILEEVAFEKRFGGELAKPRSERGTRPRPFSTLPFCLPLLQFYSFFKRLRSRVPFTKDSISTLWPGCRRTLLCILATNPFCLIGQIRAQLKFARQPAATSAKQFLRCMQIERLLLHCVSRRSEIRKLYTVQADSLQVTVN